MRIVLHQPARVFVTLVLLALSGFRLGAQSKVYLLDVPDYEWHAGCFGVSGGMLMGYWDRHGFPNLYTGPTAGGVAPLDSYGANFAIRSLWASRAGQDGRPADQPGHIDDYWKNYDSDDVHSYADPDPDPYVLAGRPEHEPDCIGDFVGLSQLKWKNQNGECDGNVDAMAFIYWNLDGNRRVNFVPPPQTNGNTVVPGRDVPSGLREFARWRGYDADVFSQLTGFNPTLPPGKGFTFADVQAEIDAGYPFIVLQQTFTELFLPNPPIARANPGIHAYLIYGYVVDEEGNQLVIYHTCFAAGEDYHLWNAAIWDGLLPVRGVIGLHPKPKIMNVHRQGGQIIVEWHGPAAELVDEVAGTVTTPHGYVLEKATSLKTKNFTPVTDILTDLHATIPDTGDQTAFFRVRLVKPPAGF